MGAFPLNPAHTIGNVSVRQGFTRGQYIMLADILNIVRQRMPEDQFEDVMRLVVRELRQNNDNFHTGKFLARLYKDSPERLSALKLVD